jgi:hypothetical protein
MEYVFHSIRPSSCYSHASQHISNLEHLHTVFHSLPSFPQYPISDLILTHLGYDDNDLDLDLLCRDIVRRDIQSLKRTPCANAWLGPRVHAWGSIIIGRRKQKCVLLRARKIKR